MGITVEFLDSVVFSSDDERWSSITAFDLSDTGCRESAVKLCVFDRRVESTNI